MTDAWDGRPQNPEREGWHWVQHRDNAPEVLNWSPLRDWHYEGDWVYPGFIGQNYRYIGPCLTPAEIEARVAQARREALEDAARLADMYGTGKDGIRASRIIRDAIRALKEQGDG
jgi:hypothetical protein